MHDPTVKVRQSNSTHTIQWLLEDSLCRRLQKTANLDASSRCFEAGVRKHSPCSTKLRPKKCRINVSAFFAEIFANSQVSPRRKNVHIPDKDLRVSILSKRRKPKRFAKSRENTKSKISRWRCRNCPKGPPAISSRRVLSHHWKTLTCKKTDEGLALFSKMCFRLFFDLQLLLENLFVQSKLHAFSLMSTFFCVTLHGDSDWNAQNMHRGRLQAT